MSHHKPCARTRIGFARQTILAAVPTRLVTTVMPATGSGSTHGDSSGDVLARCTGPPSGGLDIVAGCARFTSTHVEMPLTVNGAIGNLNALPPCAWGVNRGNGTVRLVTAGRPAVVRLGFDSHGRVVTVASALSPGGRTDVHGLRGAKPASAGTAGPSLPSSTWLRVGP